MPTLEELRALVAEVEAVVAAEEERTRKPWHADLADLDDHRVSGPQLARIFRSLGSWLDELAEKSGASSPMLAERTSVQTAVENLTADTQAKLDQLAARVDEVQARQDLAATVNGLAAAKVDEKPKGGK